MNMQCDCVNQSPTYPVFRDTVHLPTCRFYQKEIIMYEEYNVTFVGPCTCDHHPDEHGWHGCDVNGCNCEAHWEE